MGECFKCGVSGERAKLFDAISNRGLVKICEDCASREDIPIVKRPTENQILESKTPGSKSIRDRLKNMQRNNFSIKEPTLRDLVDKKFKANDIRAPSDLRENFHWTIQRIKRARKITREEFAKAIGESEANIRLIEQGILPNNDYKIINKIESYLKINLRKGSSGYGEIKMPEKRYSLDNSLIEKELEEQKPKKLSFNIPATKELKINDLRNMKKKQEESKSDDVWEEEYSQDDEQFLDEREEFNEEEDK